MSTKDKKSLRLAVLLRGIRDFGADELAEKIADTSKQNVNYHYKKLDKALKEAGL